MCDASTSSDPLIDEVVEGYRIERRLGAGGMGVVYLARHRELSRTAALKTLPSCVLPDEEAVQRFRREAEALARVHDDGLVHIYNVGQLIDGRPYILMEYIEGELLSSFRSRVEGGRLSSKQALELGAQLAMTIAAFHLHKVAHRDIKPDNIMLVPDPLARGGQRTKILDMGIAKLLEDPASTRAAGTPSYMAPECWKGEYLDGKVDVYSLGCVLYELLSGSPPFLDAGGSVHAQHQLLRPVPLHRRVSGLPLAVSEFVLELLAREPADRPSAQQTAERALYLQQSPDSAAWRWRWIGRWLRAHARTLRLGPGLAFLSGMLLLLLLLALFASDWLVRVLPWPGAARYLPLARVVRVPGGTFVAGSSRSEIEIAWSMARDLDAALPGPSAPYTSEYREYAYLDREQIQRTVTLPALLVDRYEVTNTEFADFLNTRLRQGQVRILDACPDPAQPSEPIEGYRCVFRMDQVVYKNLHNDPNYGGFGFESGTFVVAPDSRDRPVVAVSFAAAFDFCAAAGKRLPTEIEWEYVARRGGRRFPWGDLPPSCSDSVIERSRKTVFSHCLPPPGRPLLPDVGSLLGDRTLDGVSDMGGSVMEWTSDRFSETLAPDSGNSLSAHLLAPTASADRRRRATRGGGWTESFLSARGAARFGADENILHSGLGFRCVQDLP